MRNYGTDPETTALVDNLDIFIVPQINGDGATHSMYDSAARKNLTQLLLRPDRFTEQPRRPGQPQRLGRRHQPQLLGRLGLRRLPGRDVDGLHERQLRRPVRVLRARDPQRGLGPDTFPNIKFANNIHSSGGYFMWPPGAYKPVTREPLPYPPYGTLNFFDQAAKQVLDGIKAHRGTAILPQRTGPVIDVLYSAAGN